MLNQMPVQFAHTTHKILCLLSSINILHSKLKQFQHEDTPIRSKDHTAPRQQYFRYLKGNPIFVTLCDTYGGERGALEKLGFLSLFEDALDTKLPTTTPKKSYQGKSFDKKAAVIALKRVQEEVERLSGLIDENG